MSTTKLYSTATGKKGVNHVRDIVESANSIFHEIHQENDYGSDAMIELVDGQMVTGITIAVQIKSGSSFCTENQCKIKASKNHYEYWFNHTSPFIGIVYDPEIKKAFWINIKSFLDKSIIENGPYTITFKKTELAGFSEGTFKNIFLPIFLKKEIHLILEKAIEYANSCDFDEHCLGISRLIRFYCDKENSWDCLLKLFEKREVSNLSPMILYYIAHIPWHGDIAWLSSMPHIPDSLRKEIKKKISSYGSKDIIKMLSMIDEEFGFERGSLGQSAESIINIIEGKEEKLKNIISNINVGLKVRDMAIVLFAYYEGEKAIEYLNKIASKYPHSTTLEYVLGDLKHHGYISIQ